jgi:hypothetical protein
MIIDVFIVNSKEAVKDQNGLSKMAQLNDLQCLLNYNQNILINR